MRKWNVGLGVLVLFCLLSPLVNSQQTTVPARQESVATAPKAAKPAPASRSEKEQPLLVSVFFLAYWLIAGPIFIFGPLYFYFKYLKDPRNKEYLAIALGCLVLPFGIPYIIHLLVNLIMS